jgi:hypothetical protein
LFDKGKPVERRGRKAMDLKLRISTARIARPPKTTLFGFRAGLSAFINVENSMTLKNQMPRTALNLALLLFVLATLFFNPVSTLAKGNEVALPSFTDFSQMVQNDKADVLRGVYVSSVLALPVVQQPDSNPGYVSSRNGLVTQFSMAAQYGNIGLLAHNNLSGRSFSHLAVGQEVRLIYGNGSVEYFVITEILQYQALQPTSMRSEFRDLATDETITANQLFEHIYTGKRHITFQTCIEANGNLSWGRLFIVAEPKVQNSNFDRLDPRLLQ